MSFPINFLILLQTSARSLEFVLSCDPSMRLVLSFSVLSGNSAAGELFQKDKLLKKTGLFSICGIKNLPRREVSLKKEKKKKKV